MNHKWKQSHHTTAMWSQDKQRRCQSVCCPSSYTSCFILKVLSLPVLLVRKLIGNVSHLYHVPSVFKSVPLCTFYQIGSWHFSYFLIWLIYNQFVPCFGVLPVRLCLLAFCAWPPVSNRIRFCVLDVVLLSRFLFPSGPTRSSPSSCRGVRAPAGVDLCSITAAWPQIV